MKYYVGDVVKVVKLRSDMLHFSHRSELGIICQIDDSGKNFIIDFGDGRSGWWTPSCISLIKETDIDPKLSELSHYSKLLHELNKKMSDTIVEYNKEVRKNRLKEKEG